MLFLPIADSNNAVRKLNMYTPAAFCSRSIGDVGYIGLHFSHDTAWPRTEVWPTMLTAGRRSPGVFANECNRCLHLSYVTVFTLPCVGVCLAGFVTLLPSSRQHNTAFTFKRTKLFLFTVNKKSLVRLNVTPFCVGESSRSDDYTPCPEIRVYA